MRQNTIYVVVWSSDVCCYVLVHIDRPDRLRSITRDSLQVIDTGVSHSVVVAIGVGRHAQLATSAYQRKKQSQRSEERRVGKEHRTRQRMHPRKLKGKNRVAAN